MQHNRASISEPFIPEYVMPITYTPSEKHGPAQRQRILHGVLNKVPNRLPFRQVTSILRDQQKVRPVVGYPSFAEAGGSTTDASDSFWGAAHRMNKLVVRL